MTLEFSENDYALLMLSLGAAAGVAHGSRNAELADSIIALAEATRRQALTPAPSPRPPQTTPDPPRRDP